jgi:ribosomal protein L32
MTKKSPFFIPKTAPPTKDGTQALRAEFATAITKPEWPIKKPRRIAQGGREYQKRMREVEERWKPPIVDCKTCGSPRHLNYICTYCGNE